MLWFVIKFDQNSLKLEKITFPWTPKTTRNSFNGPKFKPENGNNRGLCKTTHGHLIRKTSEYLEKCLLLTYML